MHSVDPNDQKKMACFDIDVEVDDPLKSQMSGFLSSTTNQQEIAALEMKVCVLTSRYCDDQVMIWLLGISCCIGPRFPHEEGLFLLFVLVAQQIHETIESINQLKTQRDFMLSFSNSPQDFIRDWLKSQSRDLKVPTIIVIAGKFLWQK